MSARRSIVLLVVPFIAAAASLTAVAAQPPNIVFIFADDWGWGQPSCHGHPHVQTPNIDRLAAEGIDFTQFNVCNPVCSPSRTAAMTGHFPSRYSVHQHFAEHELNQQRGMPDWLDPKVVMLPRLLREAGYHTGHFGKWHLTNNTIADAPHPKEYGFDESAVWNGPAPNTTPDKVSDEAIKFITENKDGPFYVNVWLHETHTPHYPTTASLNAHKDLDEQHRVYAAVVADGDRKVGQILDALRDLKLDDRTIVIFSSDNGPEWTGRNNMKQLRDGLGTYYSVGETGGRRGRKRSLFEGGVHVPFIVRWPGHVPAGATDNASVIVAVDLLPTLCAAANVALPSEYEPDGENVLPAFEGHPITRTKPLFWKWNGTALEPDWWPRLAVRTGDWKLYLSPDADRAELYNLKDDPVEKKNLSKSQPNRVGRLSHLLLNWELSLPKSPPEDCITKEPALPVN